LNAETKTREWTAALAWIRTHRDAINLMHRAARRPMLGYIFRPPQPDERLRPLGSAGAPWPSGDTALASLELPEKDLRLISELLLLDGWARIEQNDASGIESVQSLLRLAEQSKAVSFDDVNQVGLSSWTKALNLVELALTQHPTLWSDEQLATLAHQLCIPRVQADFMDVDRPRLLAYDAIQRAYTDNGHGDGRITPAARHALDHRDKAMFWLIDRDEERWFAGLSWLLASRAETIDAYNAIRAQVVCDLRRPFRETLGEDSSSGMSRRKFSTWISRVRFQTLWLPGTRRMHSDYYLGRRDGVVVGIALELYRRDHDQQYPHTLNQLVPKYLPETPEDRITGGPLHYLLRDGRPIVYSAGGDGDDDGGRLPPRRGGLSGNIWAASWPRPGDDIRSTPDGDWVLYPEPDPRD